MRKRGDPYWEPIRAANFGAKFDRVGADHWNDQVEAFNMRRAELLREHFARERAQKRRALPSLRPWWQRLRRLLWRS